MKALCLAVAGAVLISVTIAAPVLAAPSGEQDLARAAAGTVDPRGYVDDAGYPVFYLAETSTSNCGGNTGCDIKASSFMVGRSSPGDLVVVVLMEGPTDASLPTSASGGLILYLDSDDDRSDVDFALRTARMSYPLAQPVPSPIVEWDGDSWESTPYNGSWYRAESSWIATIPWQRMGISSAVAGVEASDSSGRVDYSPSVTGTPLIPIAALVAGAPGQPKDVVASPGKNEVTVSWTTPATGGVSAVSSYVVTASPSGETCSTTTTSCTVSGLPAGVTQSFAVSATNAQGTGPASDPVLSTPYAPAPSAPTNLKATYKVKGSKGSATVTWTRPAGSQSMEVRWALNGRPFTAWRAVSANKVVVTGLQKRKVTVFEVRGINSGGPGESGRLRLQIR